MSPCYTLNWVDAVADIIIGTAIFFENQFLELRCKTAVKVP